MSGYFRLEERDDHRAIRAKVTGQVVTLDEGLQETVPALLALLNALPAAHPFLALGPHERRQQTLSALKRLLLRESQEQPLLLVFEDLHWIDPATQTLLNSLIPSLLNAAILMLVNYRPEYQHPWANLTFYTQQQLAPLPLESTDELLQVLLGDHASLRALKKLLIERTEGNPLFLEECIRILVETQALLGEPGTYRLAHDMPALQIPPTVQAIVAARIDRLPPENKQLLQKAAVIGQETRLALLLAITDLSQNRVHHSLASLQAAGFLYEAQLFPYQVYTFKHGLTRDVAYTSLLLDRRRALHERVGTAVEIMYARRRLDYVDMLAHHFEEGRVWDKAVRYHLQAAEKARGQHLYPSAAKHCQQALNTAANSRGLEKEMSRGRLLLGDLWGLMGNLEQANQWYEQALEATDDFHTRQQIVNKRHRPHSARQAGAKIAFYEHGSGKTTLLFTNPIAYGLALFQPLLERLCQDFRILIFSESGLEPLKQQWLKTRMALTPETIRSFFDPTLRWPLSRIYKRSVCRR